MPISVLRADTSNDIHASILSDTSGAFTTASFASLGTPNNLRDVEYIEDRNTFVVSFGDGIRRYNSSFGLTAFQGVNDLGGFLMGSNESSLYIIMGDATENLVSQSEPKAGLYNISQVRKFDISTTDTELPRYADATASYLFTNDKQGTADDEVVSMCCTKGDHLLFFYRSGRIVEAVLSGASQITFPAAGEKLLSLGPGESLIYATCDNSSPASDVAQHKLGLFIKRNGPGIAFRTALFTPQA